METNEELVAQTSSSVKKKPRKAKRIGFKPKKAENKLVKTKKAKNDEEAAAESVENEEHSELLMSEDDNPLTPSPEKKSVANKGKGEIFTQKVNDLISEEEREQIESLYYVDLSYVDKKKVNKSIFAGGKLYRCKICQAAYWRLDKCQVHVWRHFDMLPYVCYACDFKALTVTSIRGHIRKFHLKLKPFKCDQCDKSYAVAVLLKEHMITHLKPSSQTYQCDNCNFSCQNKRVLVYHMTKHKLEKDVLCDICGKGFYTKKKMREHRNTHEESNALQCDICQAYVSTEKALRRHHANVHTKDYSCQFCDKKCTTRKALHNHVYQVHSEGRHQCPLCPNVYKNGSMLQDHILKHQGIRKYKCEVCGKAFAQRTHVTTHMAVHDNRRHECPGCYRAFNRQDNMKAHTKTCARFLANPELAKLLATTKYRSKSKKNQNKSADLQPILDTSEAVNITVKVEPTLDPDMNIKDELQNESD